ncbi:glycosyltransferase [Halalkalibacter alkalisediminis]|uniref:Glycosyltransferase n=1 Tax=Halalkalibacter alkalisediminis TaxID=935616 RepID=A0ABV6NG79_9BACI|nr:glycosyltransferase [Halalkalibacter alkalisediminis]
MKAGIPILCSDFPSWKAFVLKYKCGIAVNPNHPEEVKEAINFLIANPEQAKEMGRNGQTIIHERLNWDTEKDKLVQWYNGLLDKRS